ncbi:MAG: NAD-dependent epimerase/dehydratase family protein [Balneolaceae bacterium]|nr:NAD-dependent epimerase/dehydratase family protein [Balneolaceae bacterium]
MAIPWYTPKRRNIGGNVNRIGFRGVYDEAKRFAEAMTMAYHRYHDVETRIVRIFNTYGSRMRIDDGRALPTFMSQAIRGEPLTVYGDGSQTRSFCYVDDLVEGIWRLSQSDSVEPVNIGNPDEVTILEFAKEIIELTGSEARSFLKNYQKMIPRFVSPISLVPGKYLIGVPHTTARKDLKRPLNILRSR